MSSSNFNKKGFFPLREGRLLPLWQLRALRVAAGPRSAHLDLARVGRGGEVLAAIGELQALPACPCSCTHGLYVPIRVSKDDVDQNEVGGELHVGVNLHVVVQDYAAVSAGLLKACNRRS